MINLPPADWKHIQAQIAAASKTICIRTYTTCKEKYNLLELSFEFQEILTCLFPEMSEKYNVTLPVMILIKDPLGF